MSREGRLYGFGACGNGELGHEALGSSDFQQLPIDFALNSYPPIWSASGNGHEALGSEFQHLQFEFSLNSSYTIC